MKLLDLFSGIGGFSLAASWAGIETVAFCEQDKHCRGILKKHWPDVPIHDDIKTLRGEDVGATDIISGGFPCQPFSCAGKRQGKADDRYLWPEMLKVIQEVRPAWVLGENVAGIVGMELDNVLSDLESTGYEVQPFVIPACAVNAPHRRDRVWIVAHSERNGRRGRSNENAQKQSRTLQTPGSGTGKERGILAHAEGWKSGKPKAGDGGPSVSGRSEALAHAVPGGLSQPEHKSRKSKTESYAGIGAFPSNGSWWATEPGMGRVAHGIPTALDGTLRRYGYENVNDKKSISTIDQFRQTILHEMWREQNKIKQTSHGTKSRINNYSVHEMSCLRAHEKWNLGQRFEKNKELRNMWQNICSAPFAKTQNLQQNMLEQIRETERNEKVAPGRVARLKALGNAIVPQVAYQIFEAIKEANRK